MWDLSRWAEPKSTWNNRFKIQKINAMYNQGSKSNKGQVLNSHGPRFFPFSYFAFCLLTFSQLITDIKNTKTILKTRATDPYFG